MIHESSTTYDKKVINSITLNSAFKNKKIKLLKIDAEGHELEVLEGGLEILKILITFLLTVAQKEASIKTLHL